MRRSIHEPFESEGRLSASALGSRFDARERWWSLVEYDGPRAAKEVYALAVWNDVHLGQMTHFDQFRSVLKLSQAALYKHLKPLVDAGVVRRLNHGWVICSWEHL